MRLSGAARALWGKSDRERNDGAWHPLLHHMLDVAACAEAILEREPRRTRELYARDLGYADTEVELDATLGLVYRKQKG